MKKMLLGMAICSLFAISTAQVAARDMPATLAVTGVVSNSDLTCAVTLKHPTADLPYTSTSDLITQGEEATQPYEIEMTGVGDGCDLTRMVYRFTGTPDNADGNVLANLDTSEGAAKGVGIGIFDTDNSVLPINNSHIAGISSRLRLQMVKLNGQEVTTGSVFGSLTIQLDRI